MSNAGRPRLLADEEKRRTLFAMIAVGSGREAAARHLGCSVWTIAREAVRDPEFGRRLRDAETSAELLPLQMMRKASGSHWRAAAWLLERLNPEQFVRRRPDTLTPTELNAVLEQVVGILAEEFGDHEQRERILQRLQQVQEAFRQTRASGDQEAA